MPSEERFLASLGMTWSVFVWLTHVTPIGRLAFPRKAKASPTWRTRVLAPAGPLPRQGKLKTRRCTKLEQAKAYAV